LHAPTLADLAFDLAKADHQPARKSVYLAPLRTLQTHCRDSSLTALGTAVSGLALDLAAMKLVPAPDAAAEAALAAAAGQGTDCGALADAMRQEVDGRLRGSRSLYSGSIRFAPPLTAEVALAVIRHSLLPGQVHVVYALTAYSCQQAIYMGPALGRKYGNSSLGAFVELTSGHGVGHGRYDANRVDRARITPLGRIGGQPCT
jgi:hypothetical protein